MRRVIPTRLVFWLYGCAIGLFWTIPHGTAFQSQDYAVDNTDWNGFSEFVSIAESSELQLSVETTLDYGRLQPEQILVFVHPLHEVNTNNLIHFVADGGQVLWLDDFGASDAFLRELGITRSVPPLGQLPHHDFLNGNPGLPVFHPTGEHPLFHHVSHVVANHPAVLSHDGPPLLAFDIDGALFYAMRVDRGRVLVVADPSMFINHMLKVADNRQFAHNVITYLCAQTSEPCAGKLFLQEVKEVGEYHRTIPSPIIHNVNTSGSLDDRLNDALEKLFAGAEIIPLIRYLSWILVFGLIAYCIAIFPIFRAPALSQRVDRKLAHIPHPQTDFEWHKARLNASSSHANYVLLVSILKDNFLEFILPRIRADIDSKSEWNAQIPELIRAFSERYLDQTRAPDTRIEKTFQAVLERLAQLPPHQHLFWEGEVFFSERELKSLYDSIQEILEATGLKEEYERITHDYLRK